MVRRPDSARFMGGAWVFPGGALDDSDAEAEMRGGDEALKAWQAAALRELVEETGIWLTVDGTEVTDKRPDGAEVFAAAPASLDADALHYFANWITPAPLPIRFDTKFFVAEVGRRVEALVDGKELIDAAWIDPADALERAHSGDWLVAFPTHNTLEVFSGRESVAALIEEVSGSAEIPAIQPRIAVAENEVRILLPTDPGFEEAGEGEADPELLTRALAIAESGGEVPAEMRLA